MRCGSKIKYIIKKKVLEKFETEKEEAARKKTELNCRKGAVGSQS
jgi:hypothetical protein